LAWFQSSVASRVKGAINALARNVAAAAVRSPAPSSRQARRSRRRHGGISASFHGSFIAVIGT
jgi:hypothetical protein